jgi:small subunit ribosomal protein S1
MVVLSLRKASQANAWDRFEKAYRDGDLSEVVVSEANKGGLLLDVDGIKGFIPVSQLAPVHYPRVDGADAGQILMRLKKLVGQKFTVKVINIDRSTGKMILSERAAVQAQSAGALQKLTPGDVVKGEVSGVVKFGIFVTFNGLEGLVHISEIAWGHVSNPHQYAKVGDSVEVAVIGIEKDKLSLSMKRLLPDPWDEIADKYPMGARVKGTINRFSQFGAFVQLEGDINGLIHLSEISDQKVDDPRDFLSIGDGVEATVINIDRDEHRIGLSLKGKKGDKAKKSTDGEEAEGADSKKDEEVSEKPDNEALEDKHEESPKEDTPVEDSGSTEVTTRSEPAVSPESVEAVEGAKETSDEAVKEKPKAKKATKKDSKTDKKEEDETAAEESVEEDKKKAPKKKAKK